MVRKQPRMVRIFLKVYMELGSYFFKQSLMVRTFLKVHMELGSYFLFLQEQIKDIIIILLCHNSTPPWEPDPAPARRQRQQQTETGHGRSERAPGRHRRAETPPAQHDCVEAVS